MCPIPFEDKACSTIVCNGLMNRSPYASEMVLHGPRDRSGRSPAADAFRRVTWDDSPQRVTASAQVVVYQRFTGS
jgi:hypothetical protein